MDIDKLPRTIYGVWEGNELINLVTNEVLTVTTYASLAEKMEGIPGFHNLRFSEGVLCWVSYEFVPMSFEDAKKVIHLLDGK